MGRPISLKLHPRFPQRNARKLTKEGGNEEMFEDKWNPQDNTVMLTSPQSEDYFAAFFLSPISNEPWSLPSVQVFHGKGGACGPWSYLRWGQRRGVGPLVCGLLQTGSTVLWKLPDLCSSHFLTSASVFLYLKWKKHFTIQMFSKEGDEMRMLGQLMMAVWSADGHISLV